MEKALLLCASHNDLGMLRALKKLNYYVIVTGNCPGLPGEKEADEYIQADYSDKETILEIAKEKKIDIICQCCNDFGVYTAAYVAEQMGLPGYDSYENTILLHNKDLFKHYAVKSGLSVVPSYDFTDKGNALAWLSEATYPLIIKPVDASAGNGTSKIDVFEQAEAAIDNAFLKSREKRIVAERYIEGSQYGFCTFLIDQKVVAYCSNNEYSILNPYRVEIDTFPADNCDTIKETLILQIEKIAENLRLVDGIFHLQFIVENGIPYIIEVMRRVPGNMYTVPANKLNHIDWDYWEVRARCGLSLDEFPRCIMQNGYYAYKTILAKGNGRIKKISISGIYKTYITDVYMLKQEGDSVENYLSEPVGFIFMQFNSQEQMKDILVSQYESSMVEIEE